MIKFVLCDLNLFASWKSLLLLFHFYFQLLKAGEPSPAEPVLGDIVHKNAAKAKSLTGQAIKMKQKFQQLCCSAELLDHKAKDGWRAELVQEIKDELVRFKASMGAPLLDFQFLDLVQFRKLHKHRFQSHLEDWVAKAADLDALGTKIQNGGSALKSMPLGA